MTIEFKGSGFPKTAREVFIANSKALLKRLAALNVAKVRMEFYGSGDSGEFDAPSFYTNDGKTHFEFTDAGFPDEIASAPVPIWLVSSKWVNATKSYFTTTAQEPLPLTDAVKKTLEDYVNDQNVDWYNNEGGAGYIEIDVANGTFELNIDQYIQTTENALYEEDTL